MLPIGNSLSSITETFSTCDGYYFLVQTSELAKFTKCWEVALYDPAQSKKISPNSCVPLGEVKFQSKAYFGNTENITADRTR